MVQQPFYQLDDLLGQIGEAGKRLSEINACEGAAGNISLYFDWQLELRHRFPIIEQVKLPVEVPQLAGKTFIVSGSGTRLRDAYKDPTANLGCLVVDPGGSSAQLHTAHNRIFKRLSIEFNSHLAVHYDQVLRSGTNFHAVIHAQPLHLTYLSQVPQYQDEVALNRRLLRWQPETIMVFQKGIGIIPCHVPGSISLMHKTVKNLQNRFLVIWSKHGVVGRSDTSMMAVSDMIEYAEAAAHYEYLNLACGEKAPGMCPEDIMAICSAYGIDQAYVRSIYADMEC
jgi:rhamnulose-1-phosphate aldolase